MLELGGLAEGLGVADGTRVGLTRGLGTGVGAVRRGDAGVRVGAAVDGFAAATGDRVGDVVGDGLRGRLAAAVVGDGLSWATSVVVAPAEGVGDDREEPVRFRAAVEGRSGLLHPVAASRAASSTGTAAARRLRRILHSVQAAQGGVKVDGEAMTLP